MRPEEVKLIHVWANNPDIIPLWYQKRMSLKEIKEDWKPHYFSDKDPKSGRCFAIDVRGNPIGMVNYNKIDEKNRRVEIDILIGKKENWNKGYGTDALKTLTDYLFKNFELNEIWLAPHRTNSHAIRAYEKVGFKKRRTLRKSILMYKVRGD